MSRTTIGGNKKRVTNILAMTGLIIIFIAYMFPYGGDQFAETEARYH